MRKPRTTDAVVTTIESGIAYEAKVMPDTLSCGACGDVMDFISIEEGYSCRNSECMLHVGESEHV